MAVRDLLPRLVLFRNVRWQDYEAGMPDRESTLDLESAEASSSELWDKPGVHYALLDLDVPAYLVPSSTEGHSHLYIEHEMSWEKYEALLVALGDAGILESGYVSVSRERKFTALRLPWVKKSVAA